MTTEPVPPPPRRGPAPTKHVDILWAAAELFGRHGVAQTTTRQVAAAAQTTERTLFKHFGSKEGLVQAVIGEAVVAQLAPVSLETLRRAIESEDGDLHDWHLALLRQRSESAAQAPELARLLLVELLRDEQLRGQFAAQWRLAAWQPLVDLFRRLQRARRVRRDVEAEALARMFISLNVGHLVARHILAPQAAWQDRKDFEAIARVFAAGAAPPAG